MKTLLEFLQKKHTDNIYLLYQLLMYNTDYWMKLDTISDFNELVKQHPVLKEKDYDAARKELTHNNPVFFKPGIDYKTKNEKIFYVLSSDLFKFGGEDEDIKQVGEISIDNFTIDYWAKHNYIH